MVCVVEKELTTWGGYDPFTDTIYIKKGLPDEVKCIIIAHELIHRRDRIYWLIWLYSSKLVLVLCSIWVIAVILNILSMVTIAWIPVAAWALFLTREYLEYRAWKKSGYTRDQFREILKKHGLLK